MSLITHLQHKQVLVLGLGMSGLSCVRYLTEQGVRFAVNDSRENPVDSTWFKQTYPNVNLVIGHWDASLIAQADVIIVSPGVNLNEATIASNISENCQVLGDVELFFQCVNEHQIATKVIAVTGSNGKSTVVSLLAHIARELHIKAQLAGNIGVPVLDTLNTLLSDDIACLILELSSFQLETLKSMPATAATVLNISDDHLDRHVTIENYQAIKQRIYHQSQSIIFNRDDALTYPNKLTATQKVSSFGSNVPQTDEFGLVNSAQGLQLMFGQQVLLPISQLPIAGIHNALNCLAALALGHQLGWPLDAMVKALTSFQGLAHRCEKITSHDAITWVNDSKATNVGATLAAIEGLAKAKTAEQKLILIAGGDGKGADFSPLKQAIEHHVDYLITLGKDGAQLAALTAEAQRVHSLEQAVVMAKQQASQGDIVLLSPACASLDMFKNFAARGECFIQAVHQVNRDSVQEVSND